MTPVTPENVTPENVTPENVTPEQAKQALLHIATVVSAHGLKGAAKLKVFLQDPLTLETLNPLVDGDNNSYQARAIEFNKGLLIVKFKQFSYRDQIERLIGLKLYAPQSALPALDEDEFFPHQLQGLHAYLADGQLYGTVLRVQDFGAGDLLEIERAADEKRELLPFTKQHVPQIDLVASKIIIEPLRYLEDNDNQAEQNASI